MSKFGEKIDGFVGLVEQFGLHVLPGIPFGDLFLATVDQKICHAGTLATVKCPPLL